MAFKDYRLLWTDGFGNTRRVQNIQDARITLQTDAKANSLELVLNHYLDENLEEGAIKFQVGEVIKVYATEGLLGPVPSDFTDLLGTFKITDIEPQPTPRTLKLVCTDLTYNQLNQLYTRDVTGTAPDIINNIVQWIDTNGINQNSQTTYIQGLKSDGTVFPEVRYTPVWKTAYDAISELSQTNYTGDDRAYIFWVNPDNSFTWIYPPQDPEPLPLVHGQFPVLDLQLNLVESQVISMIIFDAGEDKNGNAIMDFEYKADAAEIKGAVRFQPMIHISPSVKARYTQAEFDVLDNATFRDICTQAAKGEAQRILQRVGQGLWEAVVEIPGARYMPGALYTVRAPLMGFSATNLRLERVVHSLNRNGWQTRLQLKEDPAKENI